MFLLILSCIVVFLCSFISIVRNFLTGRFRSQEKQSQIQFVLSLSSVHTYHQCHVSFRDPCCHFQAGFARQPAGLDPIFTSIVHGSSQLCPLLAQAHTSQPTKGSKCSSLFLPPSISRGFWTAELFPIPFHSFAFDTVSPSSNWTLQLETDSPVTEIQVSGQK